MDETRLAIPAETYRGVLRLRESLVSMMDSHGAAEWKALEGTEYAERALDALTELVRAATSQGAGFPRVLIGMDAQHTDTEGP